MPKNLTPAMRAHLDEETTHLAAIWRITRKDGQEFFFTDHDRDIVFGGEVYRADAGFERTAIRSSGEIDQLDELEARCLAQNAEHVDWECTEELMARTTDGEALYMHCLPADISGVSCDRGEVAASVFENYRLATYQEASWKPFVIAMMIVATRFSHPSELLTEIMDRMAGRVV